MTETKIDREVKWRLATFNHAESGSVLAQAVIAVGELALAASRPGNRGFVGPAASAMPATVSSRFCGWKS